MDNMLELLQKYPKAAKLVKEYYLEQLMKGLKEDLPEEFKQHVKEMGIDDDKIAKLIEVNPRAVFDIFDDRNILISIHATLDSSNLPLFGYTINDDKYVSLLDRLSAERLAVERAIEILESKLS